MLEKERTTPDQYPLSLNALTLACNQSTARDPVMSVDPSDVQSAIASLKGVALVRLVHPSHGRSVTRFRQVADEHFGWSVAASAVMSTLLLRGPQTTSEIRTRSERLHQFASFDALDAVLAELAAVEPPQVQHSERSPGQKEQRWQQLLAEEESRPEPGSVSRSSAVHERIDELELRIVRLEVALTDLLL